MSSSHGPTTYNIPSCGIYDTDQYTAPDAVTYNSERVERQTIVGVGGRVGVRGVRVIRVVARRPDVFVADGDVDNVKDDAESANDDERDADDCRLDMAVRAHNGSSLVRLGDVHRLNHGSGHHGRLLLLRLHRAVFCLY